MAKNKNKDRDPKKNRSSQPEQAGEQSRSGGGEERQSPMSQGSPADMARRQQKRFGHN